VFAADVGEVERLVEWAAGDDHRVVSAMGSGLEVRDDRRLPQSADRLGRLP